MTRPSSDDWLREGFRSGDRVWVVETLVSYRIWRNGDGDPIGVTVDYEYAADVHIELDLHGWTAFLLAVGLDGSPEPGRRELQGLLYRDGHSVFENELIRLGLPYTKRSFS